MKTKATKGFVYRLVSYLLVIFLILTVVPGCEQVHFGIDDAEASVPTKARVKTATPFPTLTNVPVTSTPTRTLTSTLTATATPLPTETKTVAPSVTPTVTPYQGDHMEFGLYDYYYYPDFECHWGRGGIKEVGYEGGLDFTFVGDVPGLFIRTENSGNSTKMMFEFDPSVRNDVPVVEVSQGVLILIRFTGLVFLTSGEVGNVNIVYILPSVPGMLCGDEGVGTWLEKYGTTPFLFWVTVNLETGEVGRYVGDRYAVMSDGDLANLVKKMPEAAVTYGFKGGNIYSLINNPPFIHFK